ncbi:antA/AntB antirepressor family protein [Pantoea sp. BL1]|nr:antA/AntB antirepressor family protein [Pantoea sp. BL1]
MKGTGDNDFANIVPVLSGQIGGRPASIISAKNLHIALGAGNDFSTWIKLRIDEYGFVLGHDYVVFDSPDFRNQRSNLEQEEGGWKSRSGGYSCNKDYILSLYMAKELAMVERNEKDCDVLGYLIRCEEEVSSSTLGISVQLRHHLSARLSSVNLYKSMCVALHAARTQQGKLTSSYHYSNESKMIAKMVLGGLTAKQWAEVNAAKGDPRNSMDTYQLEHLAYLEGRNITLIEMGIDYHKRKAELIRLSEHWLTKHVGSA